MGCTLFDKDVGMDWPNTESRNAPNERDGLAVWQSGKTDKMGPSTKGRSPT